MTPRPPDLRDEVLDRMRERGAERAHSPREVAHHGGAFLNLSAVWRCLEDLAEQGAVDRRAHDRYRLAAVQRGGEQMTMGQATTDQEVRVRGP